jgi:flagellar motor switch protein FliN/FliY
MAETTVETPASAPAGTKADKANPAMSAEEAAQLAAFSAVHIEGKKTAPSLETFPDASEEEKHGAAPRDIEFLLDIPLLVSVEIGRTRMYIKDLLQLGQGSVIEFDKLVGEPMEVLVNEKLIARGEVVVVNEKFGVRLTDISSPAERLKHLK